ncbi:MAG: methylated-DNA--[protein]-cysteine S-methyltransferase [Clostridiales Family XIII bacterium]|jgi:methylated-DNA-[protein]-cysteine S-methyltransferase|nr:methylated-DNA--[protein]-cysteine S-methyltransferase [Clostridiales Family XIII bacterium]
MYHSTTCRSPIGALTLACDGTNLVGLWIEGQKYYKEAMPEAMAESDDCPVCSEVSSWLDGYFAGKRPSVSDLPLAPIGSAFRQEVWNILRDIPYGEVITYGDIAKKLAGKAAGRARMSAQAVGGAVGHNPISVIIPCHRVVGANGSLTGYAGGIWIKARLLELEGVDMTRLFMPKKGTAL